VRKLSYVFEIIGVIAVAIFLVMLFANDPTAPPPAPAAAVEAAGGIDGAQLYKNRCAGCHGGDGSGGIGPRLAGRMTAKFPDPAAQIAVVTNGRGGMPAFGERMTPEEIAALVAYTREHLGT
jgi:mono/diheme cytochrome c family protein